MKTIGWFFAGLQLVWLGASVYWATLGGVHGLATASLASSALLLGVLLGARLSVWALRGRS